LHGNYYYVQNFRLCEMKDEILKKSLQLFLKHGIREMSNQRLVELLGISTKTLYKYFRNKEELLKEALDLFHSQHRKTWKTISASQNAATLFFDIWYTAIELEYKVNKAFFQELNYYYPDLLRKKEAALGREYAKQFIQVIYKGIQQGVFQKNINAEIIFTGISVLYQAIVREDQFNSYRTSAHEILLNTITHYIRGFCTEEGVVALNNHIQSLKTMSGNKAPLARVTTQP
jgi:AcrR family transcriptional regulator